MSKPKVLVVDDEPGVLGLVAAALSLRGYEVQAETSPRRALELAKATPCFDLLVSDVLMPGMCGPELVRQFAQLSPATAFVMMSAYIDNKQIPSSAGFISKPFLMTDLYSVVEKTLARRSAAARA